MNPALPKFQKSPKGQATQTSNPGKSKNQVAGGWKSKQSSLHLFASPRFEFPFQPFRTSRQPP
jgi:hypothetical protein